MTFKQAIQKLANNVQWLVNNDKLKADKLNEYNQIIEGLQINYNSLASLVNDKDITIIRMNNEIARLEDIKNRLEIVCLLHGITDLPLWMNKPPGYLTNILHDASRNNWTQLPYKFQTINYKLHF